MKQLSFSTKAETLKQLEGRLSFGKVLPQCGFTVAEYRKNSTELNKTLQDWSAQCVIVRSSARSEDSITESKAGQYLSIPNVSGEVALHSAIKEVIASYDDDNPENQVLIQPMLKNIQVSGVLFTADPQNGSPYLVINYDDTTGSTDSVTSGQGECLKTCYHFSDTTKKNPHISACETAATELMHLFAHPFLDIEFAICEDVFYILQVRPLIVKKQGYSKEEQRNYLEEIHGYIQNAMKRKPYLYGDTTIFGVMPDWNPAEIIGLRPKPLALSLYKYLVTDGVWAYQRDNYGYKNLRSFPLMMDFFGLPYIDTRVSFNSFIPKTLDHELSEKLTNYYLKQLEERPEQQDKVEFHIILSCFTFDMDEKLKVLKENGFSEEECEKIKMALLELTNRISHMENGLWKKDCEKIALLEERLREISHSDLSLLEKIYWLLEDCTRYGTLPFAGLARVGFISVLLLKSMVTVGLLSEEDYHNFMGSLHTVSSQMSQDYQDLSMSKFMETYGHLRPGTYDILSPRYDQGEQLYFSGGTHPFTEENTTKQTAQPSFKLSIEQYQKIQDWMKEQGFALDVLSLFGFIKMGIEQREYSKFIFSKSLSLSLELVAELGAEYGFSREDMAFFDIQQVKECYSKTVHLPEVIEHSIHKGKARYETALKITLPPVIIRPEDVFSFHISGVIPNYITQKQVTGQVISQELSSDTIAGKILLIPSADPGFDWIFAQEIKGFVTAYGGVNSHMAIRAGELGIPAVIGVGEQKFQELVRCTVIKIDCESKKMEILS